VDLAADVAALGPTLDLTLRLVDADGNTLAFEDTANFGERVVALLPAGDYYLAVASRGAYGDVGQYTISGTTVPEPTTVALVAVTGIRWLMQRAERHASSECSKSPILNAAKRHPERSEGSRYHERHS
jgi:hypothetical protein